MAVNPVQFLVASSATVVNGDDYITITGNVDCSRVYSGTAIFLAGADNPVEGIRGSSPDGSGNSTITLRNPWSGSNLSGVSLIAFNTNEGLADAIINVREIVSNVSAIEDLAGAGILKKISDTEYQIVNSTSVGEALLTANDAATQRSLLGLGGSATLPAYTDYGIGGVKTLPSGTSLLSITENGLYYVPSATNAPSAQTPNWLILVNSTNNSAYRTVKAWGVGKIAVSYGEYTNTLENGTWGGWRTVYDSGNSKNPLEYGMAGSTALVSSAPNNNLNEVTETRIVRADNANDKPTYRDDGVTPGMSFYLNRYSDATAHRGSEICFGHLNSATPKSGLWHRSLSGTNGASEWLEIYDSGNSSNPNKYGIGAQAFTTFSDWNDIPSDFRGVFRVDYNALNTPAGVDPLYVYHGMFMGSQYDPLMIIWGADGTKRLKEYALRVALSGDTWEGTKTFDLKAENYHSGNTNFNEFSAGSANDIIAYGYAVTSGIVQLFFPLNSKTAPVSLTVNGTFKLKGAADADRATGITTLGLNNLSTNKLGVCRVSSGLTGVVQGEPIVLVATASGDSVTFNF